MHRSCAPGRTAATAHQWGSLTNIGKQRLPSFNLGEALRFASDWKAHQISDTPVCQLLHHCVKTNLPLLCHTLCDVAAVFWPCNPVTSAAGLTQQMLAELRLKMYTLQSYQSAKVLKASLKETQVGQNSLFKVQIQMSTHRKYVVVYTQIL